jgi:hypothetical protein
MATPAARAALRGAHHSTVDAPHAVAESHKTVRIAQDGLPAHTLKSAARGSLGCFRQCVADAAFTGEMTVFVTNDAEPAAVR